MGATRRPRDSRARQVQHRLDAVEVDQLLASYRADIGVMALAGLFGVSGDTVRAHLDRAGVARRPQGLELLPVSEVVRLYGEGWPLARLGERYGVDAGTVRTALLKAGTKTRPRPGRE